MLISFVVVFIILYLVYSLFQKKQSNDSKALIILVVGLVIAILIMALIPIFLNNPRKVFVGDANPSCENFKTIFSEAGSTNNPSLCSSINDNFCLQNCISQTAYQNRNESYCRLIQDERSKSSCYAQLATIRGAQVCNSISVQTEVEGSPFYCISLHSTSSIILNKGGSLCASPSWKEGCISKVGSCELLTNQKLKDICLLESRRNEFYAGNSQFDCNSLGLSESKKICSLAKDQKVGFASSFTSENLEATCGNNVCNLQESAITCPQDCRKGSGGCVAEGNFVTEDSVGCCTGLVEETKVELKGNGEFICKDISNDYYPRTCIKPNDGVCGSGENSCNSPQDCKQN